MPTLHYTVGDEPQSIDISQGLEVALRCALDIPKSEKSHFRRRTWLYVPLTRIEEYSRHFDCGMDGIIFDLEDSVPSDEQKMQARRNIPRIDRVNIPAGVERVVRVNRHDTMDFQLDLEQINFYKELFDAVVIAKAEDPKTIEAVRREVGGLSLSPLIETPLGVRHAWDIAQALDRSLGDTLGFGAGDYSALSNVDWQPIHQSVILQRALGQIAEAANAQGIGVMDAVCRHYKSEDALEVLAQEARFTRDTFGVIGKKVIHPRQVPVVNNIFTPTYEEVVQVVDQSAQFFIQGNANVLRSNTDTYEGTPVLARHMRKLTNWLERRYVTLDEMTGPFYVALLPSSNEPDFLEIERSLSVLGVNYEFADNSRDQRVYRIPAGEVEKLPRDESGPYLPVTQDSGHGIALDREGRLWQEYTGM